MCPFARPPIGAPIAAPCVRLSHRLIRGYPGQRPVGNRIFTPQHTHSRAVARTDKWPSRRQSERGSVVIILPATPATPCTARRGAEVVPGNFDLALIGCQSDRCVTGWADSFLLSAPGGGVELVEPWQTSAQGCGSSMAHQGASRMSRFRFHSLSLASVQRI